MIAVRSLFCIVGNAQLKLTTLLDFTFRPCCPTPQQRCVLLPTQSLFCTLVSSYFREAADPPPAVTKSEDGRSQSADIYADDAYVGRFGAVPQLSRTHLPAAGWQHTGGAETGRCRCLSEVGTSV